MKNISGATNSAYEWHGFVAPILFFKSKTNVTVSLSKIVNQNEHI